MMKKGMIYKIELQDEIYIGSTEVKLCERQSKHNYSLKRFPHQKLYKKCIEQGITEIKLIWVADIEFNHTAEKRMIEEEYRKKMNGTLNSYRCYITEEDKKESAKEYREKHKENFKEYHKGYYEKNKEEIAKKQKEYKENNKDKINEYINNYYEKNKEKITDRNREKIKCEICNINIRRTNLLRHQRSNKCMNHK